jgi:hypothetical protein
VTHEVYIKRTVFVAKCNCGQENALNETLTDNAPCERRCNACGEWISFVENSVVAPEYKANTPKLQNGNYNVTYR